MGRVAVVVVAVVAVMVAVVVGGCFSGDVARNDNGFARVGYGVGIPEDTVVIVSARNCQSGGSIRANELAEGLQELDLPVRMVDSFRLDVQRIGNDGLADASKNLERVFAGSTPIVVINQMASANPTLEQVVDEFDDQVGE